MTVRFGAVPHQGADGNWWYPRTNPDTGEIRPHGPFATKELAWSSIAADRAQTEYAISPSGLHRSTGPMTEEVPIIFGSDPGVARGALRIDTPKRATFYTITDQIDQLLDSFHPADTTYSVTFTAEIDADTGSSTVREEIGLAELQAIRAILALRPR